MTVGIITAASDKYANSLFCLLGSLNCNWHNHPEVVIYDLGLSEENLSVLKNEGISVRTIPPFCSHWRKHYTWKIWCMASSEFDIVIWMDAGMCILEPLDEVIEIIKRRDYFIVPNYQFLDYEASEQVCHACEVDASFKIGKGSVAGTFIGFIKNSPFGSLISEALKIATIESNIKAYHKSHKHDQALISILTYKHFPNPIFEDGIKYLGWSSPRMTDNQKVWLQRRQILLEDIKYFRRYLSVKGLKYSPKDPQVDINFLRRFLILLKFRIKGYLKTILNKSQINGIR